MRHLWHWMGLVSARDAAGYVAHQLELAGFWELHPFELETHVNNWLALRKRYGSERAQTMMRRAAEAASAEVARHHAAGRLVYGYRDGKPGWY